MHVSAAAAVSCSHLPGYTVLCTLGCGTDTVPLALDANICSRHSKPGTCEGVVPPPDIMASCSASSYTMRCPLNRMSHSLRPPLGRMPTCTMQGTLSRVVLCGVYREGRPCHEALPPGEGHTELLLNKNICTKALMWTGLQGMARARSRVLKRSGSCNMTVLAAG